ncbi:glycosyltransferase family 4 protein [Streptomyces aidingensis]|uniref:D-inositol 3-phosphate glycosyltransferase n=1 Tax=Streptomyces aidingensis TaxID=910347 RepID=A0A1I1UAH6_9ACTN|nr:glycosyltransferase family 4 protein [Streptomyces aidingensis]SFD67694.1 Glycosyltransferase involved in cell wall bisynthesis [Streptomyces aidingensis]
MTTTPPLPRGRTRLHVVQLYSGGSTATGVHVRSLAAGLAARGLRVTVCAPRAAERRYRFAETGARFAALPSPAHRDAVARLRQTCGDADLVHAHGLCAGAVAALAVARTDTPLVVTWHTRPGGRGAAVRVRRLTERWVARAASVVLGATSDLVERARLRGARDARLAPVALPSPRTPVPPGSTRYGTGQATLTPSSLRAALRAGDRPLLLAVGRLAPHQGHDTLLTAARSWRGLDPCPLLLIAGEGRDRAALQERIDRERLPVRLLGSRPDVLRLLGEVDLALVAARWAGRSLIAQEALRGGVPLVATAVGGLPELVGDAAVLVPYGDAAAVAGAVAALLADPARRAELAAAGQARAATWPTEDSTVAQVLSIYDEFTHPPR